MLEFSPWKRINAYSLLEMLIKNDLFEINDKVENIELLLLMNFKN